MTNPLHRIEALPEFSKFHVEHIKPAIEQLIAENLQEIEQIVSDPAPATWENLVEPLEVLDNRFERVWGPVRHLDAVNNSDEWHQAYNECLPLVSEYHTLVGQNQRLYKKFKQLAESEAFENLDVAQRKVVENALRNFRLSGIALPEDQQKQFKEISQKLSELSSQFSNNVLKATQAWQKHITDASALKGLPESALDLLAQYAQQKGLEGWLITLDFPSYHAVITYADDRDLREEVYRAYSTRASDQFFDPQYDNSAIIEEIRALRHQKAQLLGFKNYAEYSIETKMVESTSQVVDFLEDLADKSKPQGEQEIEKLRAYARDELGIEDLQAWDAAYVSEKLKEATLSLSQEQLRPYFPVNHILQSLFDLTQTLFDVQVVEKEGVETWHPEVRFYELKAPGGEVVAAFYLDLYARENKRGGAWMDSAITRWKHPNGTLQIPVAYLVCNFAPPVEGKPTCLTHNEVTTLFHEFGHGLHHMLTEMEVFDVSGINSVPWDAVELPSQFMENFCWALESLTMISAHVETGEPLPASLMDALQKSRHFLSAMQMLRQLEFGLFDFLLHLQYDPKNPTPVEEVIDAVRKKVSVLPPPKYNRFAHSFSHIFAGGYAAGYFSYKWAEVLSADAFSLFEEQGILNAELGMKFRNTILAAGGSIHPMKLFEQFRGRKPSIEPLLKHSGIEKK
jgi:oligopeptidase A